MAFLIYLTVLTTAVITQVSFHPFLRTETSHLRFRPVECPLSQCRVEGVFNLNVLLSDMNVNLTRRKQNSAAVVLENRMASKAVFIRSVGAAVCVL